MSELAALNERRSELLEKIREIEENCEGVENENNARQIEKLSLEKAKLTLQKNDIQIKLNDIQGKISSINAEIAKLSGTGTHRILEAIKNQRWYFFKNRTKILMDRNTGLLWLNLNYFEYCRTDKRGFSEDEVERVFTVSLGWFAAHEPEEHIADVVTEPGEDFPFELVPGGRAYRWRKGEYRVLFYRNEEAVIWGMTAKILHSFIQMYREAGIGI